MTNEIITEISIPYSMYTYLLTLNDDIKNSNHLNIDCYNNQKSIGVSKEFLEKSMYYVSMSHETWWTKEVKEQLQFIINDLIRTNQWY